MNDIVNLVKRTTIYVTLQIEGTHNWPDCPFEEVDYLRDPHRHVFWIKAHKVVTHSDRDVEFIMLKHQIRNYLAQQYYQYEKQLCVFGAKSCEMIAEELCSVFELCACDVSEDNENGAIVTVERV